MKLSESLLRYFLTSIEKVQVVGACYCDSKTLIVSFIESFSHASVIIKVHTSVMHQFYSSLLECWATLSSVVHQSQLTVTIDVSDCDGCIDRVVVTSYVVWSREVPCWSVVKDSLLHLQTISISVEGVVVIEILDFEVDSDFLALIGKRDAVVKTDKPFWDWVLLVKPYLYSGILFWLIIIEFHGNLRNNLTILNCSPYDSTVEKRIILEHVWSEYVNTTVGKVSALIR